MIGRVLGGWIELRSSDVGFLGESHPTPESVLAADTDADLMTSQSNLTGLTGMSSLPFFCEIFRVALEVTWWLEHDLIRS